MNESEVYIGLALGGRRRVSVCAVSPYGQNIWLEACRLDELERVLLRIERRAASRRWSFGIATPRAFPSGPRAWDWSIDAWARATRPLTGRHCEVVLKALGLCRPAWTPSEADALRWMRVGSGLFRACEAAAAADRIHEIVPAASRGQFARLEDLRVPFRGMIKRPRSLSPRAADEFDAFVAAWTVATSESGRGCTVGGGDGLGAVLLPGSLPDDCPAALLEYPVSRRVEAAFDAREPAPMR